MGFEFIDSTGPVDPASRLRIRRQAALGKNLGRKLNRPSKKKKNAARVPQPVVVARRAPPGSQARQRQNQRDAVEDQLSILPSPEYQVGNTLTQLQFCKIGPDGLVMNAISFILQAPRSQDHGIGRAVHTGKVPLFSSFMFQDEAYFHSTVAFALRALSNRPDAHGLQSMLAIQHMARSLQLINSRFGTAESISDINLAVVVVMTQYTRMSGQMDECRIHLDGLERMVQLRGGINALRPELAEKIFRVDLGCAYQMSAPTRFTIPELEQFSWSTIGPGGLISKAQREVTRSFVRPELIAALSPIHQAIFLDATQLSCALDEAYCGNREWLTISELHQSTLYMGYRIVGAPRGTHNENSDVDLLARLGLVTFCLSFFRSFDANIVKSSALGIAIGKVVQILRPRGAWTEELTLWVILMGHVVQIFGDDVWPHVTRRARSCIHNLDLTSWSAATKMLLRYPWTDALWGSNGKIMWDALMMLPEPTDAGVQFEVPMR